MIWFHQFIAVWIFNFKFQHFAVIIQLDCGASFIRVVNDIKHFVNTDGKQLIDDVIGGVEHMRRWIEAGDISRLSSEFRFVGMVAMKKIRPTITSYRHILPCKRAFRAISALDNNVSRQLKKIESAHDAKVIACYILDFESQLLSWCYNERDIRN